MQDIIEKHQHLYVSVVVPPEPVPCWADYLEVKVVEVARAHHTVIQPVQALLIAQSTVD